MNRGALAFYLAVRMFAKMKYFPGRIGSFTLHFERLSVRNTQENALFSNIAIREDFLRRDRPQKNMLTVLDGGMCRWHPDVKSGREQRQML